MGKQKARVLVQAIKQELLGLSWTRAMMAEFTELPIAALCARIHELEQGGFLVRGEPQLNYKTNRQVLTYRLAPKYRQEARAWQL